MSPTRRAFSAGVLAAGLAAGLPGAAFAAPPRGKPERPKLRIGTAVDAMTFLPIYVAAARTWSEQGLDVEVLSFRGDAEVSQALVGGSIDISAASLNGLINMISASQPVMGFYAGFHQADFTWISQPAIKQWSDLKGKTLGVATFGSLTDALSRYALRRHALEAEKDVQIVQAGSTPSTYQALISGKLAAGILSPPFSWQAQDAGLTVLGTQARDVAPAWPKHLLSTKTAFLTENPNTMVAVLRGHVAAIRLARANRDAADAVMMERLKLTKPFAERAYEVEMPGFDERGSLPEKEMPVFWDITVRSGDVDRPWPESRFLDRRYINTFAQWAP
jgi:NitT/TauT family transport system substrate-binding protein